MESSRQEHSGLRPHWLKASLDKLGNRVVEIGHTVKKLSQDDPRRIVHGVKVGLAITLVSLLYYFEPLFEGFGVAAMWAVLTVVVVFEFSVGATLGKGVNRVVATVFGAMLGVGAHDLASLSGETVEPFILALFVFALSAVVTFMRFIPELKARHDYGLMIMILTFSLVCVSGYRDDEVWDQANRRMSTILVGSSVAVAICILICPVWAGTDLHNLVADNVEKLANFLQEFGEEYFREAGEVISDEKKEFMEGFKSVLNSKNSEDSLVNYAKWEPRHGRIRYRHPWKQYQKIGNLTRELACTIEALNRYLHYENQAPKEVKAKMEEVCKKMSWEAGKALKDVSTAMKKMSHPPSIAKTHLQNSQSEANSLIAVLETTIWNEQSLVNVVPAATVASLLLDAVTSAVTIAEAVEEVAGIARFEAALDRMRSEEEHVITVEEDVLRFPTYKDPPSLDIVRQSAE